MAEASPPGGLAGLPPLRSHRSLTDAVHDLLRDAITHGVLGPGTRLPEVTLARRLDVSPTPVREALRRLGEEGLVLTAPHRGASVAICSPAELADLYEIHEVLESHAVRRATLRVAAGDMDSIERRGLLTELDVLLDAMDTAVANADHAEFNRLDLAFHHRINALGQNDVLTDQVEQIHRRIQSARIRFEVHLPDRPARSQEQHRVLVDVMGKGDVGLAESLAREHIRAVRDEVLSLLATEGLQPA